MHRTEGVDYTTEEGKRRYIDPNLPSVRGTVLNAESMNAIQEEICNVIEKAGLTLNTTAALDRTDGWDQLWEAITASGIIGAAALDSATASAVFSGMHAVKAINVETPGACWTRIGIVPQDAQFTHMFSGRITHLGSSTPANGRGMDFHLVTRNTDVYARVTYLDLFTDITGVSGANGTLYWRDAGANVEVWAFCTGSVPRIDGAVAPDSLQYWNPDANTEFTNVAPEGVTAFAIVESASTLYTPKPTSGTITVTESTHESQFVAGPANGDTVVFPNTHTCWAQLSTSPAIGTVAYLYPQPTDLVDGNPYAANVSFLDPNGEAVRASIREATGDYHYSAMTVVRKGSGWQIMSGGIQANIMSTL